MFSSLMNRGRLVAEPGQEGELYVRASTVASGYWDEVEKTDRSFVKNPLRPHLSETVYKTGDLVHLDLMATTCSSVEKIT